MSSARASRLQPVAQICSARPNIRLCQSLRTLLAAGPTPAGRSRLPANASSQSLGTNSRPEVRSSKSTDGESKVLLRLESLRTFSW
jgi:hypothetical protein